jgi:hypothetical protein
MVGIRVFVCSFRIRTFRGLKPQPGCQAVAAAKECPEKAPSLQKAQGWATQLQRQKSRRSREPQIRGDGSGVDAVSQRWLVELEWYFAAP